MSNSARHKERRRKRAKHMGKGNERGGGIEAFLRNAYNDSVRRRLSG